MNKVRTRVAPSPTGYPHLATIYQGMFDYAWAKKNSGDFLIRIEDTDMSRFVEGAEAALYSAFEWFGITPAESPKLGGKYGPYRQSERLEIYKKHALELIEKGNAYYCFCTAERLEQVRTEQQKNKQVPMYDKHCRHLSLEESKKRVDAGEKYVIRMKMPENQKIIVKDLVRGELEFDSNGVDDQVILKTDGFPTYHLAVVVDDHYMEISHVLRGPEWISSYPKHKVLYDYFGWEMPEFVHTPLITNMDGSKLSKRQGHASVDWYRRKGFLPEAVLNFISLLGWSHPDQKEIFSFDEFIEKFDLKDISAVSPKFDLVKLEWMNGQYIQSMGNKEFIAGLIKWLDYCFNYPKFLGAAEYVSEWKSEDYERFLDLIRHYSNEDADLFAELIKTRIKKFEDVLGLANMFIKDVMADSSLFTKQRTQDEIKAHLIDVVQRLSNISEWNVNNLKQVESSLVEKGKQINWKTAEIFYPIRLAVSGGTITPPLFESIYLLGKEKTISNLNFAVDQLGSK